MKIGFKFLTGGLALPCYAVAGATSIWFGIYILGFVIQALNLPSEVWWISVIGLIASVIWAGDKIWRWIIGAK
jgi:hypothetical protein